MSEKRFSLQSFYPTVAPLKKEYFISDIENEYDSICSLGDCIYVLNDLNSDIAEVQSSDRMGWSRAEKFEKELKQKKIYIKRLEYKVQKFKEMNGEQQATIKELQQKYDKLCMEIANIYSKYILIKEFSEDTNPNEAVKYVLRELMQKTKEVRR